MSQNEVEAFYLFTRFFAKVFVKRCAAHILDVAALRANEMPVRYGALIVKVGASVDVAVAVAQAMK